MDIGYLGAFLGGVLSLLSPCSVMLLPAFFAYAFTSPAKLLSRTGIFTLGLLTTLVPLGVFSGVFGSLMGENRGVLITVVGVLIIVVGLVQLLGIPLPGLSVAEGGNTDRTSVVSVFLLGAVYAVAGVCTGPILGAVLMMASLGGSPLYGGILLAIYALGMVTPLLILTLVWKKFGAAATKWMRPRTVRIGRWQNSLVGIITGVLSILLGLLLLFTDGTAALGGLVSVSTQFRLETELGQIAGAVPDWLFAVLGAAVLGLVVYLVRRRNKAPVTSPSAIGVIGVNAADTKRAGGETKSP